MHWRVFDTISNKMKLNKKGGASDIVLDNIIYLVIVIFAFLILYYFVLHQQRGAAFWEDYYSKEIAKTINLAENGDEIRIDVQMASEIAEASGTTDFQRMFEFKNNSVCVQLRGPTRGCYLYYKDYEVINPRVEFLQGDGGKNVLAFSVIDSETKLKFEAIENGE